MKPRIPDDTRRGVAAARRNGELIKTVAHRFGISESMVVAISRSYGISRVPKWRQIVDYAVAHPNKMPDQIAAQFGSTPHSVEVILSQHGIARSRGILALGREAHRAGLTISDIRAIAEQRGAA